MKTRVLVIVDTLAAGGAERVAVESACALDRERFAVHVVVTRSSGPLARLLEQARLPYTVLGRTRRFDLRAWRRLRMLATHADVLHSHKLGSNVWGALLTRRTGVPLVAHEHNFSGGSSRARALLDRGWVAPAACYVVCVSESVAQRQRAHGVPSNKLVVLPNAVRLDQAVSREHARRELDLPAGARVVGVVGRLRPEKGHDLALRAFARMPRDSDTLLCIVGDGPETARLHALARELDVEAHVHWVGERRDAARLAAAFDVALISSQWEGLPLAALEALAAGVPLVATAVGALPQLAEGGAAVVVPPGDADALATELERQLADPDAAATLGAAGRARVADRHSFPAFVASLQQLYAAARRRPAPRVASAASQASEEAA